MNVHIFRIWIVIFITIRNKEVEHLLYKWRLFGALGPTRGRGIGGRTQSIDISLIYADMLSKTQNYAKIGRSILIYIMYGLSKINGNLTPKRKHGAFFKMVLNN